MTCRTVARVLALLALPALAACGGETQTQIVHVPPYAKASRDTFSPYRVVAIAEREWRAFGSQWAPPCAPGAEEGTDQGEATEGLWQRVGDYWWESLGSTRTGLASGGNASAPWSAAFISYVMTVAGGADYFPVDQLHARYINWAIDNRLSNRNAMFYGYRLQEYAPQPGDLVCNARRAANGGRLVDYDNRPSAYFGHCDIVVARGYGTVEVVGGNVGDSVRRRTLLTSPEGYVLPTAQQAGNVCPSSELFAIIAFRRATPVAALGE